MKKILLALVIVLMTITLVTGCQKKETAPTGEGALTVEIFDRGTDGGRSLAYDNAWTDWVKAKVKTDLNIDVTFVPVGRWSENTDIVNLMASQSAPDLCYTYAGDMISNFRDQGGILNLAPYIEQYLPDLKRLLGADPALSGKDFIYRNQDQNTGHVYSIMSARVALAQRNIFIRQDWLTALGLPMPTTIQEFYNTLVAFRDRARELPGNIGTRVVPYGQNSDARWGLRDLIRNFIQPMSDRDRWVYSIHERDVMMPGFKEGVREMNKWYNERLIYQDFPLMTTADDFYNQMKSGVVGSFSQNWDLPYRTDYNINAELARNIPGAVFVPVDLNLNNREMMDKAGLHMFIPSFSKNIIGALKYLNWLAKFENYNFLQIGTQGVNHTIVNGVPSINAMPANHPWFQNSAQNIDMTMPLNGVELGNQELNSRVLALGYGSAPPDQIVNAYAISVKNARAGVVHQVTTTVVQYSQVLQDKGDALLAQAIRATPAQFDSVYDTAYRDWVSSGAQEVYNERARLYP